MDPKKQPPWSVQDAAELYGIDRWGSTFFGLSKEGKVTANTLSTQVPLLDIVEGMVERDLQMPVLLRIENILDAQVYRLNHAFRNAIEKEGYAGQYRGVYPIKVNQQAQIVEQIAQFGARFHHGFEVGSKPEMIAALSALEEPGSLIICNGYKDEEFIDLALQAVKLGHQCFIVLETPAELSLVIDRSRAQSIEPLLGVRMKMTTQVSGHWNSTSGDRSVFGLTTVQLIEVVDKLKSEQLLHCLRLLHCHLGSQIPNIHEIRQGVVEACRCYADLAGEGASMGHINMGGGLAVDYTGTKSNDDGQSRNYSLDEYCCDIVSAIKQTLEPYEIPLPTIVTESGRATVAHSSVLLFNVLDTTRFEPSTMEVAQAQEHQTLDNMRQVVEYLEPGRVQECFNDAHFYRNEARELFRRGQIDLRSRAAAENLFLEILHRIADCLAGMDDVPQDLEGLRLSLADIYYGNFSLFQSLPDIWAIDQLFPIMPIHRLDERPVRDAVIADITCDCDGKIDRFVGVPEPTTSLSLHPLREGEEYYLGVFLVGAYQETLGDLHNLFGDTNVVSVHLNRDGSFDFVKEIYGDTIADVLSYVEYNPKEMQIRFRNSAERAVREGRITARERQHMMKTYNASMRGYTYYERES